MKYIQLTDIQWDNYSVIGFDMDGTLFDEYIFIQQVYKKIARYLGEISIHKEDVIYYWLLDRWKQKGSSYPYIFSEALVNFNIKEESHIKICLSIFRSFNPKIILNRRIISFLDKISQKKQLFLVTDGHELLQRSKFDSLGLSKWFQAKNVVITGSYGTNFYKPNIDTLKYIKCLRQSQESVLYVGDRSIDEQFAENAGFDFLHVNKFNDFWGVDL